ncbi:MAG: hypothetical protein ACJ8AD_14760 [Gemmatimonadaceae bacterium]
MPVIYLVQQLDDRIGDLFSAETGYAGADKETTIRHLLEGQFDRFPIDQILAVDTETPSRSFNATDEILAAIRRLDALSSEPIIPPRLAEFMHRWNAVTTAAPMKRLQAMMFAAMASGGVA